MVNVNLHYHVYSAAFLHHAIHARYLCYSTDSVHNLRLVEIVVCVYDSIYISMRLTKNEREYLQSLQTIDKYSEGRQLTKEVLKAIALGGAVASLFILPGAAPGFKFFMDLNSKHKRKLRRSLNDLIKNGYIQEIDEGKYGLTSKGYVQLHKHLIADIVIPTNKVWDGYFRIIMFDIPESKKYARNALNRKLKELGFLSLQRSVHIFPFDFKSEFEEIGKLFDVEDNIIYIKTKDISQYESLKKRFKKMNILKK